MLNKKTIGKVTPLMVVVLVGILLLGGAGSAMAVGSGSGIGSTIGSMADQVASYLGISRQDLSAERHAGKSLADIAAAKKISKDELAAKMLETRKAALEKARADQKITQTQYESCLQNMEKNIEKNITRTTVGPNGNGVRGQGKGMGLGQGKGKGQGQAKGQGIGRRGQMSCDGQCTAVNAN